MSQPVFNSLSIFAKLGTKTFWIVFPVGACVFHNSFLGGLYQGVGGREGPTDKQQMPSRPKACLTHG